MKRSLAALLISLLLVPSLVCAMSVCPVAAGKAASSPSNTASPMPNCHGEKQKNEQVQQVSETQTEAALPMLIGDCLGIDILYQLQNLSPLDFADHDHEQHHAQLLITSPHWHTFSAAENIPLRAPPLRLKHSSLSKPLYFSTQRIRI